MIKGLKYRAKDIGKYEKENNTNLAALLGEAMSGVDSLAGVVALGMGCDKDKAYDLIQSELDEGVELEDIQQDVLNALAKSGFMRGIIKKLNIKQIYEAQIMPHINGLLAPVQTEEMETIEPIQEMEGVIA